MNHQQRLAVIIPAHNEAAIIQSTLQHLVKALPRRHIFVVDDCSADHTARLARRFTQNIAVHRTCQGKGSAINTAIRKWRLADRYDFIMPLDADTYVTQQYFSVILSCFQKDLNHSVACVSGRVITQTVNWLTAYRQWEYEIGQTIHKTAQSYLGGIIVCPGCATVYRSSIFKKLAFPTHSLAEDMDLTFAIHRRHLGKIVYEGRAFIHTQDPKTFKDFVKQIERWYIGLWQCITKYNIPWEGQMLDLEVAVMASEGLFSGLIFITFILLAPFSLALNPIFILIPLLIDIFLFLTPSIIFANLRHRQSHLLRYFAHFYFLRVVSSLIFFKSFIKVMLNWERSVSWFSPHRYQVDHL
jgi:poly-beta-1,6-N-acetyl-D-glucosamine synthase